VVLEVGLHVALQPLMHLQPPRRPERPTQCPGQDQRQRRLQTVCARAPGSKPGAWSPPLCKAACTGQAACGALAGRQATPNPS
jgi:hypothetical protein